MARNHLHEVHRFLRVAIQRLDEARFLFEGERCACAIYLSGYAVECGLKSLILSVVPKGSRKSIVESFRGGGWHDLNRLYYEYLERGGNRYPPAIAESFSLVNEWTTDLRYTPGERPFREADRFLRSTEVILEWVQGRL